jgi:hypothetical protein
MTPGGKSRPVNRLGKPGWGFDAPLDSPSRYDEHGVPIAAKANNPQMVEKETKWHTLADALHLTLNKTSAR